MIVTLPQSPKEWHQKVWSLSWPMILANLTIPLVGVVLHTLSDSIPPENIFSDTVEDRYQE